MIRPKLLAWYHKSRRDLPWRRGVTPYRTWVSEIMLQQTTVAAALPYYERFLKRFPDARALARAQESEVLKLWAGLGYYSRARNLHAAAKKIAARGSFPDDYEGVLDLPGVGRYTAGAILSIAFGKPYPVLDGNVMRVFARLFGIKDDVKAAETQKKLWGRAEALVPADSPGDWNQALMELGATVCLPESPDCGRCPLSADCAAFKKGLQGELPVTGERRAFVELKWRCLWIEKDGKVLLWKRSAGERFLKEHWGLPEQRRLRAPLLRRLKTVRHTITHHKISVEVYEAEPPRALPAAAAWIPRARLKDYLVSSLWLKCRG